MRNDIQHYVGGNFAQAASLDFVRRDLQQMGIYFGTALLKRRVDKRVHERKLDCQKITIACSLLLKLDGALTASILNLLPCTEVETLKYIRR